MARKSTVGWLVLIALGVGWCSSKGDKSSTIAAKPPPAPPTIVSPAPSASQTPENVSIAHPTVTPAAPIATTLYTTADVRLRAQPSTSAGIVLTVSAGSEIKSTKIDGLWHQVTYGGYSGWIRGDYLATRRTAPARAAPSTAMPLVGSPSRPRISQPALSASRSGYIRGPRGGCYYINRNGNKTYVDRSMCR